MLNFAKGEPMFTNDELILIHNALKNEINDKCINSVLKMKPKERSIFLNLNDKECEQYWRTNSSIAPLYILDDKIRKEISNG